MLVPDAANPNQRGIVLASLLCARFGHSACLSRGCPGEQPTLRGDAEVGVVAHYWTNVFPAVVLTAEKALGPLPS